jgi:catechol 2,3-dioxygenase-like lactoylglutathione lyase family enzyme
MPTLNSLDHVALWVADRDAIADLCCTTLGMHVIERTDDFTLIGADARQGKLTLFDAEGPREPGALARVVLRVAAAGAVRDDLPELEGLRLGLVQRDGALDYDLDHVVLRVADVEQVARELVELGFEERDGRLWIADRYVELEPGGAGAEPGKPLLNHLAVLVDSADEHIEHARELGVEVTDVKDAPNTYAGFVRGPEGIRIEFVEHKPTFSLV